MGRGDSADEMNMVATVEGLKEKEKGVMTMGP